jgi:hypothetical protein
MLITMAGIHYSLIPLFGFDGGEQIFQAVQRGVRLGLQNLPEVFYRVSQITD